MLTPRVDMNQTSLFGASGNVGDLTQKRILAIGLPKLQGYVKIDNLDTYCMQNAKPVSTTGSTT